MFKRSKAFRVELNGDLLSRVSSPERSREMQSNWELGAATPITDSEFFRLADLIRSESGIHLTDAKRALLVGRLSKRLRALGFSSFTSYYRYVCEKNTEERVSLINSITTHETSFFREPVQFEYLRSKLLPSWTGAANSGSRHLRIWSAACSTGEEPYSIAMTVSEALKCFPDHSFEVFASDISTRVLDSAEVGLYPIQKKIEIPAAYRKAYMLKGRGESAAWMKVGQDLASKVTFSRVNLIGDLAAVPGTFDAIFCRNVLIYFQPEKRNAVLSNLVAKLRPGGHLFLGHAETMHGVAVRTRCPIPHVYICSPT